MKEPNRFQGARGKPFQSKYADGIPLALELLKAGHTWAAIAESVSERLGVKVHRAAIHGLISRWLARQQRINETKALIESLTAESAQPIRKPQTQTSQKTLAPQDFPQQTVASASSSLQDEHTPTQIDVKIRRRTL
jgi:hypothetical protein